MADTTKPVHIDKLQHRRVRMLAASTGKSIQEIVKEALEAWLKRKKVAA